MTVATKRHLERIHTLRCVVCWNCAGKNYRAEEAHHIESVRGEHSDFATVPLCKHCHDLLHGMHREPFYRLYKLNDVKLLAWTIEELQRRAAV